MQKVKKMYLNTDRLAIGGFVAYFTKMKVG
jgi:hypothetical protein